LTSTITSHQCAAMHFTSGALYHLISLCYNIIRYALRCPVSVRLAVVAINVALDRLTANSQ
jgi:hypothetical protein